MDQVDNKIKELSEVLMKLKDTRKKALDDMKYYDIMLAEFYHLFESGSFPPKVRKVLDEQFDECLKQRRIVKRKVAKLQSISSSLKNNELNAKIDVNEKGKGIYKPTVLTDIFVKYEKYIDFDVLLYIQDDK